MHFEYLIWAVWGTVIALILFNAWNEKKEAPKKEAAKRRAIEEERVRESEAYKAVYKLLPSNLFVQKLLLKRLALNKGTELLHKLEHMPQSGLLALQHVGSIVQDSEPRIESVRKLADAVDSGLRACNRFLSSPARDNQHRIRLELPEVTEQLRLAATLIRNEHDTIKSFVVDTIADIINGHAEIATNFAANWEKVITRSVSKCEAVLPVAIPALQQARHYLRW